MNDPTHIGRVFNAQMLGDPRLGHSCLFPQQTSKHHLSRLRARILSQLIGAEIRQPQSLLQKCERSLLTMGLPLPTPPQVASTLVGIGIHFHKSAPLPFFSHTLVQALDQFFRPSAVSSTPMIARPCPAANHFAL